MDYQTITLPIVAGINTKTHPLANQPPQLNTLVNASFQTVGSIGKSKGYDSVPQNTSDDTQLTNGVALGTYQREFLQFDGTSLFTFSPAGSVWINKGPCNSVRISKFQVARPATALTLADVAIVNNIAVYAYSAASGGIYISVVDITTGTKFQDDVQIDATATFAKCYVQGPFIWIACAQTPEIRLYFVSSFSPLEFEGYTAPISNLGAASLFDIVAYNDFSSIIVWANTSNFVTVAYVTQSGFLGDIANGYPDPFVTTGTATTSLGCVLSTDMTQVAIAYANTTQYMSAVAVYTSLFGTVWGPLIVDGTTTTVLRSTIAPRTDGDGWDLFYTYEGATADNNATFSCTVGTDGTVETSAQFYRSLTLISRAFTYGAHNYMFCEFQEDFQSSYFLVRDDQLILGRMLGGAAGDIQSQSTLANVPLTSSGVAYCPVSELFLITGITAITCDFEFPGLFIQAEIGRADLIAGGLLKAYDGGQVVEQGFLQWPMIITAKPQTTGGSVADGDYFYKCTYQWYDAQGNFYESTVSTLNLKVTVTGGSGSGSVDLVISTLRVTQKQNVVIAIYRSLLTDAQHHFVGTVNNNSDVDTVPFTDTMSDDDIKGNGVVYTDNGELDNDPPPPCTSIVVGKTRVFLVNDEDGSIWYSKPYVPGFGLGFSVYQTLQVDGFTPTAVGIIDANVLAFDESRTFWFTGDGPDASGQNGSFSPIQLLTSDIGCVNPASIGRGPDGLYFKSAKGIAMVSRSLDSSYVGAPAEQFNNYEITATTLLPSQNQMRFLTDTGPCIVYDYYVQQWFILDNHSGYDAVLWNGVYTYLRRTGQVYTQSQTSYLNDGTAYNFSLSTSWINLQSYQGYKRVRKAAVLGTFKADCSITVNVYYDYDDAAFDSFVFDATSVLNVRDYGDGIYGSASVYGDTSNNVLQWRISLPTQKLQALRFEVIDTVNNGNSYEIVGIDLDIGTIGGLMRLPVSKSLGG